MSIDARRLRGDGPLGEIGARADQQAGVGGLAGADQRDRGVALAQAIAAGDRPGDVDRRDLGARLLATTAGAPGRGGSGGQRDASDDEQGAHCESRDTRAGGGLRSACHAGSAAPG